MEKRCSDVLLERCRQLRKAVLALPPTPLPAYERWLTQEEAAAIRETFGSTAVRSTKVRTPRRSQNPQHYAALNTAAWLTSLPDGGIGAKGISAVTSAGLLSNTPASLRISPSRSGP